MLLIRKRVKAPPEYGSLLDHGLTSKLRHTVVLLAKAHSHVTGNHFRKETNSLVFSSYIAVLWLTLWDNNAYIKSGRYV